MVLVSQALENKAQLSISAKMIAFRKTKKFTEDGY
jgi:hypothetical protein